MLVKNILQFAKMTSCQSCVSVSTFVQKSKKILGAGVNYNAILTVNKVPKPANPIIFLKPSSSYIEEGQDIIIPKGFEVNEEIELGIIIGKKCKNVSEKEALNYVSGYCAALDLTATSELGPARKNGHPWTIGKGFDTACPVSRFISKDEICNPDNVEVWVEVNGEQRQRGNTNDLIFSVPSLISYVSKFMTLEPNDLILTGTPPGMSNIKPGDVIKGGIKDVVTICFNVKAECSAEC